MSTEEPKKKRRQNVACDSCKLRRVKCDLLDLLTSLPSSSSGDTPLADLVRQNPDVGCMNCKNKGLNCTTHGIVNPTKPNKGGRRIDEAKKKFGQDEVVSECRGSEEMDSAAHNGIDEASTVQRGRGQQTAANGGTDGISQFDLDTVDFLDSFTSSSLYQAAPSHPPPPLYDHRTQQSSGQDVDVVQPVTSTSYVGPALFNQAMLVDSRLSLKADFPDFFEYPNPTPAPDTPSAASSSGSSTASNFNRALSIWREFSDNRKQAMDVVRLTGQTPGADRPDDDTPSVSIWPELSEIEKDQLGNLISRDSGAADASPASIAIPSRTLFDSYELSSLQSAPYASPSSVQEVFSDRRKRLRSPSQSGDESRGGKMVLLTQDPWRLWSEGRSVDERTLSWGRREAVQEQLADRALGMALSTHLVKTFFQAVHFSYPAISPEAFYLDWARAGQRSDRMTPAQEALCAIIEAWGARYSDSPIILGLSHHKANLAPKVIKPDGSFVPGTRARMHWGRARITACKALMDRARRLIDENGLLRHPSITGVQALTLYSQLMHLTDQKVLHQDHWLQNRMMHSTIIEQMSLLGLMWDSEGPIVTDESDNSLSLPQLQLKQRRLFWTHVVGDAFFSASLGQLPRIPQEDIDSAGEWINTVRDRLPMSSFKVLAFFISLCHRLGSAAREVATTIAYPLRKKGGGDMSKICNQFRKVWKDLREAETDLNTTTVDLLAACDKGELLGFSPLNFMSTLRFSGPFLLFIMHQIIREQLDFWKKVSSSTAAYISTPSDDASPGSSTGPPGGARALYSGAAGGSPPQSPAARNVEMLEKLNKESVDGLLRNCRSQISMLEAILPTGIIQSASILIRVLMATVELLSEVPTNEQGYPSNTPGGYGWTWEAKQREVDCCVEALHQVGWAWADVGDVLDGVMLTMERMTPSPETIQAWNTRQEQGGVPVDPQVARANERDLNDSKQTIGAVLQFWPPVSIPHLIETAMNHSPRAIMEGSIDQLKERLAANVGRATASPSATPSPLGPGSRQSQQYGTGALDTSSVSVFSAYGMSGTTTTPTPAAAARSGTSEMNTPIPSSSSVQAAQLSENAPWEPSNVVSTSRMDGQGYPLAGLLQDSTPAYTAQGLGVNGGHKGHDGGFDFAALIGQPQLQSQSHGTIPIPGQFGRVIGGADDPGAAMGHHSSNGIWDHSSLETILSTSGELQPQSQADAHSHTYTRHAGGSTIDPTFPIASTQGGSAMLGGNRSANTSGPEPGHLETGYGIQSAGSLAEGFSTFEELDKFLSDLAAGSGV